MLVAVTC